MTISNFVAYVKQAWKNKPDTSTPLSAARLTHLEDGIKGNSDAIEKIAAAVVSQIVNDPNKIASMASLYSVNQAVTQLNSDLDKRLNAITITSGTLLDAIKNMGDNVHNLFVAAPYFPPDIPLQAAEFAIEIIKENDTSRIMVIAHRYGGELSSFYRTLFNGQWNSGWVQK